MTVSDRKRGFGILTTHRELDNALHALQASGFTMDQVSVMGKDAEAVENPSGAKMSDRITDENVERSTAILRDATTGAAWGSILVGLTSLAIPGLGVVIAAGSAGVALATVVAGAGLSAANAANLTKALVNLGIPTEQATFYGDRLHFGEYLIMIDGTEAEIQQAETILNQNKIKAWGIYTSL